MTEAQPPVPQKKKGLGALAWIGIGCGAAIVIGLVLVFGAGFFLVSKVKDVAEDFTENPVAMVAENIHNWVSWLRMPTPAGPRKIAAILPLVIWQASPTTETPVKMAKARVRPEVIPGASGSLSRAGPRPRPWPEYRG